MGLLNLTTINPTFGVAISSQLLLGWVDGGPGSADGTLVLDSNSVLNVGTPTARANSIFLGTNESADAASGATGVLNALDGTANLRVGTLNIGRSTNGQSASGTLLWDQAAAIDATTVNISLGAGAVGTIDTPAGGTLKLDVGNLIIGREDRGVAGVASGTLDLTTTNPTFEAAIGNQLLLGWVDGGPGSADGTLVLDSNSVLNVGTPTARANSIFLGTNESADAASSATGVLNALDGTANLRVGTLNIGRSTNGQSASGTLLWDQAAAIDATTVNISLGAGAVGTIDTPAGGTLKLDVGNLIIGREDRGVAGVASGTLDLTTTNPTFEAAIGNQLLLGWVDGGPGSADGTLVLDSNSVLNVGTPTARANSIFLGTNESADAASSATGVLNALDGTANLRVGTLNIGRSTNGQSASGTLLWDQAAAIDATTVNISLGAGAVGTIDTPAGGTLKLDVGNLIIGREDRGVAGVASGTLDLTTTNPTFEAAIGNQLLLGWVDGGPGSADGTLVLDSNSVLNVGTPTARANSIFLGTNESADAASSATGVLNALDGTANLRVGTLNIGRSTNGQSASGTLLWDQAAAIDATTVNISLGAGAVGTIDTPAGGTLKLDVGNLIIGREDRGVAGVASGTLDLTTTNPTFEAAIGNQLLLGWVDGGPGSADGTLVLDSNSVLNVGTPTARANSIFLGTNESADAASSATGVLNALDGTANLRVGTLNIGRSTNGQSASGTLLWDQAAAIDATTVNISLGAGAVGTIDTPAGGTLKLDVGNLIIGREDRGVAGVASGTLDLTTTNPTFEAAIGNQLLLGWVDGGPGSADGTLVLDSNSVLNVGTPTARANSIFLGTNESADAASGATGVLNALDGTANLRVGMLNIGRSTNGQSALGTFSMGSNAVVDATTVNIGTGTNASGTVDLTGGLMTAGTVNLDEGAFNFTGGRLAVNTFNGTLDQQGGTLAPGVSPVTTSVAGVTSINGDYNLSAGTLEIELFGTNPGSEYDQVFVNGLVDLNGNELTEGILLDLKLGFAPSLGDSFTILENDGTDLITTAFFGLEEGASLTEFFGSQTFTFEITYKGGTGNDIVLNSAVPIPPAVWLFGSGLLGLVGVARRRAM